MWLTQYFTFPFFEDTTATAITLTTCLCWLLSVNFLVKQEILESKLSRKVIHIFTGPIFLFCWNLFSSQPSAPFAAALVPFLITLHFLLIGLGVISDPETVASICRTGNPRELLYGPVFYGATFVVCTVVFWRHSVAGILALMVMCGGDGFADIVGRRLGASPESKLPWAPSKSWPGSIAMFCGSFTFGLAALTFFNSCGNFSPRLALAPMVPVLLLISTAAALAESVSPEHWDNVIVPVITVILGQVTLPLMELDRVQGSVQLL